MRWLPHRPPGALTTSSPARCADASSPPGWPGSWAAPPVVSDAGHLPGTCHGFWSPEPGRNGRDHDQNSW